MASVLIDIADRVALITVNRPERLDAYEDDMGTRRFDALVEAADRADVRAIVGLDLPAVRR